GADERDRGDVPPRPGHRPARRSAARRVGPRRRAQAGPGRVDDGRVDLAPGWGRVRRRARRRRGGRVHPEERPERGVARMPPGAMTLYRNGIRSVAWWVTAA